MESAEVGVFAVAHCGESFVEYGLGHFVVHVEDAGWWFGFGEDFFACG